MNAADQAIDEIREVRHRISAEFDHDITKFFASLREEEKQHQEQIQRGREILSKRKAEREQYPEKLDETLMLHDKPKSRE